MSCFSGERCEVEKRGCANDTTSCNALGRPREDDGCSAEPSPDLLPCVRAGTGASTSGDGGFGQYMAELTTAVKYGMNLTHVLLNNGQLGKIAKEQRAGNWQEWQTSLHNPDFARYAELCGAKGIRVSRKEELGEALNAALAHPGPALVEVMADAELI